MWCNLDQEMTSRERWSQRLYVFCETGHFHEQSMIYTYKDTLLHSPQQPPYREAQYFLSHSLWQFPHDSLYLALSIFSCSGTKKAQEMHNNNNGQQDTARTQTLLSVCLSHLSNNSPVTTTPSAYCSSHIKRVCPLCFSHTHIKQTLTFSHIYMHTHLHKCL